MQEVLPDESCTTDELIGAVLALDFGLFPLLLDDADVFSRRTPALCHHIPVIQHHIFYHKTTLGKFGVGGWAPGQNLHIRSCLKCANLHKLMQILFDHTLVYHHLLITWIAHFFSDLCSSTGIH